MHCGFDRTVLENWNAVIKNACHLTMQRASYVLEYCHAGEALVVWLAVGRLSGASLLYAVLHRR